MPVRRPFSLPLFAIAVLALAPASTAEIRLGSELQVNLTTALNQVQPTVAVNNGGAFVVVWMSASNQDGDGNGVFGRRFSSTGASLGGEFQVNDYTTSHQRQPDVASLAGGGFVVVWESYQDGEQGGIFGRRFASGGSPLANEFQVNSHTVDRQEYPAIAAESNGDFVVVWVSYLQDGAGGGIFGRRFSSAGVGLANEFQVNAFTVAYQGDPDVGSDDDGDFVVAWRSYLQDGYGYGLFARRFSSDGSPQASEFQVTTYTYLNQEGASIALEPDGDFVVAWEDDNDGHLARARRFSSAGASLATEFVVNIGAQLEPVVGLERDGDFVVAWQNQGQDGDNAGTFAQHFSSTGAALGAEFQVNSYTPNHQRNASVAVGGGRFVIAWVSSQQDGDGYGIFAQRFAVPVIFDIDGNGSVDPLTDALLGLRYTFGFRDNVLITGAVGAGCTRCDAPSIEAYLQGLTN